MKKLIFIIFILIVAIIWFLFKDVKVLKIEKNYTIVNENKKKIPAKLYYRNVDVEVGGKKENVYEIVVFFDKEFKMKLSPIVVIPKYRLIGVIEGGERGFIKFENKVFQLSEESNKFTSLDNSTFFDNPPITEKRFEKDTIIFNSFEELKKHGKKVLLIKK